MQKISIKYQIIVFIGLLIVLDQALKIYVKTHFFLGETYSLIGDWCKLCFVENEGMAFGLKFGSGKIAKIILTLFRFAIICYFVFILFQAIKLKRNTFFLYVFALVLSGAIGNLIDGVFYGLIFENSGDFYAPYTAQMFTENHYGSFLFGRVVDMFFFPLFTGTFPSWIPFFAGEEFLFFSPVFNLADSYISVGIVLLLVFAKKFSFFKKVNPL